MEAIMSMTGRCDCGAVRHEAGGPQAVIWTKDVQSWRLMPEGVPQFAGFLGR
jgi:hypothetical protein